MPDDSINLDFRPETYWPLEKPTAAPQMAHSSPYAIYGDEFLPKHVDREVEIARVSLDSTTGDTISIRARPIKRGIRYRVVSEYEGDWKMVTSRKSSKRPLTLRELIHLIETMERDCEGSRAPSSPSALRDCQDVDSQEQAEQMETFVEVSSGFYPELAEWYERDAALWLEKTLAKISAAKNPSEENNPSA